MNRQFSQFGKCCFWKGKNVKECNTTKLFRHLENVDLLRLWFSITDKNKFPQYWIDQVFESFIDAINTLSSELSTYKTEWRWDKLNSRAYPHFPFSRTTIKRLFFNEYPYGGSKNTIDTCLYSHSDSLYKAIKSYIPIGEHFDCKHSSSFKMVVDLGNSTSSRYSLDTGASESILSEFYFNMNSKISNRELLPLW